LKVLRITSKEFTAIILRLIRSIIFVMVEDELSALLHASDPEGEKISKEHHPAL
jgi:hypothetical protein